MTGRDLSAAEDESDGCSERSVPPNICNLPRLLQDEVFNSNLNIGVVTSA